MQIEHLRCIIFDFEYIKCIQAVHVPFLLQGARDIIYPATTIGKKRLFVRFFTAKQRTGPRMIHDFDRMSEVTLFLIFGRKGYI